MRGGTGCRAWPPCAHRSLGKTGTRTVLASTLPAFFRPLQHGLPRLGAHRGWRGGVPCEVVRKRSRTRTVGGRSAVRGHRPPLPSLCAARAACRACPLRRNTTAWPSYEVEKLTQTPCSCTSPHPAERGTSMTLPETGSTRWKTASTALETPGLRRVGRAASERHGPRSWSPLGYATRSAPARSRTGSLNESSPYNA